MQNIRLSLIKITKHIELLIVKNNIQAILTTIKWFRVKNILKQPKRNIIINKINMLILKYPQKKEVNLILLAIQL
jgi:hypothetical protein